MHSQDSGVPQIQGAQGGGGRKGSGGIGVVGDGGVVGEGVEEEEQDGKSGMRSEQGTARDARRALADKLKIRSGASAGTSDASIVASASGARHVEDSHSGVLSGPRVGREGKVSGPERAAGCCIASHGAAGQRQQLGELQASSSVYCLVTMPRHPETSEMDSFGAAGMIDGSILVFHLPTRAVVARFSTAGAVMVSHVPRPVCPNSNPKADYLDASSNCLS